MRNFQIFNSLTRQMELFKPKIPGKVDGDMWRKQRKTASLEFASKNLRDSSTLVFRDYALKLSTILCQAFIQNQQSRGLLKEGEHVTLVQSYNAQLLLLMITTEYFGQALVKNATDVILNIPQGWH
ncbi:uncharacterized protein LOC131251138 [Magnolia sinica]|uniref:uncharacterized protein LOC131251138 n=1 Tax=Magnolia sinica TaxID=86752 RepID=UPI00265B5A76|nr:uncharacterized protein LOC131251138 [Magnolia sinica]